MSTIGDILGRKGSDVVSMVADESVLNAARLMNERGIGGLVVTDAGRMVGIFTERDILRRVVAEHRDPAGTTLREVMTAPVATCRPDTSLDECRAMITRRRIRHIPVEDGSGSGPCGIVTSGDILAFQVQDQEDTIKYLHSYVYDLR